ncbi:MAG: protoporphyrinogen oxidase [Legionellaceae bacterium]|nr:protoporphyrinogen oxidase [Legionellaceae bacterium]
MRLIIVFLLLLASVWFGIQLSHDPGYVLIAMNQWTLETTLWVGIMALITVAALLYLLLGLLRKINQSPSMLRRWCHKRHTRKARQKTRQGLIEFSEGYWSKAQKNLIKALPDAETPLLNYLTAARAAQELGNSTLRDHYLREAQQSMPEAKIAVELTQAQLQLANCQWEQALATLRHLQDLAPQHPHVIKLLLNLYEEVRDWAPLLNLLPKAKQQKIISDSHYQRLQHKASLHYLQDLIQHQDDNEISHFVASLPRTLSQDPEILFHYTQYLWKKGQEAEAEKLLRQHISKSYTPGLIDLYGKIHYKDKQLAFAESLQKKHPHCPHLLLCCGRLSKQQQLWGKARHYLEESIAQQPWPASYRELGELLESLGETREAMQAYKAGLALV